MEWRVKAGPGSDWRVGARQARQGVTRHGVVRPGVAGLGDAGLDMARQGKGPASAGLFI